MKTIILNSGKCSWGKCLFCGWGKEQVNVSAEELIMQFKPAKELKIFCSGSLLDEQQFPKKFQEHVAQEMQGKKLYIESRPEYVTNKSLKIFEGVDLIISMGLEAADDEVLKKMQKGITLKKFSKASELIRKNGFKVKGYILVNPPYDYNGLLDKTINFGKKHCDELVLINTYPHAKSGLFDLWVKGDWKPLSPKEFNEKTKKYCLPVEPNNYAFIPKFPLNKRDDLRGVGLKYLKHPHFRVWQDYLSRIYEKPEDKTIALFLPCSKRKPYYKSRTHKMIRRMITGYEWYNKVHLVVISNPGVIPIEFSDKYPFNAYDWDERDETPELMKEYIRVNTKRIKDYLKQNKYKLVLSYFKPDSESSIALENACNALGSKLIKLVDKELYKKLKDKRNPIIHPLMLRAFKNNISKTLKKG